MIPYIAIRDCQYRDAEGKIRFYNAGDVLEWQDGMPKPPPSFERADGKKDKKPSGESPAPKFDRMTVAELEAFAAEHQISLEGCENKAQKLAAINAGLEAKKPDKEPEA